MRKAVVEINVAESTTPELVTHYGCAIRQNDVEITSFAGQNGVVNLPNGEYVVRGFAFFMAAADEMHPTNEDLGAYIDQPLTVIVPCDPPSSVSVSINGFVDE